MKDKADKVFSQYIRMRDKGKCYTCLKQDEWKYTDAGHYISRTYNSTRYDERNVHCQCKGCNIFKNGNKEIYAVTLMHEFGVDILFELNQLRNFIKQFTVAELQAMIDYWEEKIEKMK